MCSSQQELIGYLVRAVLHMRSNFANSWTKIWPPEKPSNEQYSGLTAFNILEDQIECFFFVASIIPFLRNNHLFSKTVHTSQLFAYVKLQQPMILKNGSISQKGRSWVRIPAGSQIFFCGFISHPLSKEYHYSWMDILATLLRWVPSLPPMKLCPLIVTQWTPTDCNPQSDWNMKWN